ncbi:MAG: archease [Chloroflexi bacterium]|nr:archease [Chloroflexota bacterium]
MPYEEVQHTADWCLRVWAADLPSLFVEAARGMNALSGARQTPGLLTRRTFESAAPDPESLLVSFLSELVYAAEQEHLVFDNFKVEVDGQKVKIEMGGTPLASVDKTIKAVTYHNLHIRRTERGLEAEIVFDV